MIWKTRLVRALGWLVGLQVLFVGRWAILFGLFSLTGDDDPTAVIQPGHPGWATLILPLVMLTQQVPALLVLAALVVLLVLSMRWRDQARRSVGLVNPS